MIKYQAMVVFCVLQHILLLFKTTTNLYQLVLSAVMDRTAIGLARAIVPHYFKYS